MPPSSGKLSILFLGSSPRQWQPLELTREFNELSRELDTRYPNRFELRSRWGEPATSLPDLVDHYRPQIIHFSGHGHEQGGLIFEDEHGEPHTPAPEVVAEIFAESKGVVRCVVLNACFSEAQGLLIADYVDCVIGLHDRIADETAIAFTRAFYSAIGRGLSLATAFNRATLHLHLRGTESPAVLLHRGPSSDLDTLVLLPSSGAAAHGESPLKVDSLRTRSPRQVIAIIAASFGTPLCIGILARNHPGGAYIIIAACLLVPIVIFAALTRNHIALAGSIYAGLRSLDYSSRVALASLAGGGVVCAGAGAAVGQAVAPLRSEVVESERPNTVDLDADNGRRKAPHKKGTPQPETREVSIVEMETGTETGNSGTDTGRLDVEKSETHATDNLKEVALGPPQKRQSSPEDLLEEPIAPSAALPRDPSPLAVPAGAIPKPHVPTTSAPPCNRGSKHIEGPAGKGFCIDTKPVSASQYRECFDRGSCKYIPSPGCNMNTGWSEPANCIEKPWARTYCAGLGKRIPSKEEWESAQLDLGLGPYPWTKGRSHTDTTFRCAKTARPTDEI